MIFHEKWFQCPWRYLISAFLDSKVSKDSPGSGPSDVMEGDGDNTPQIQLIEHVSHFYSQFKVLLGMIWTFKVTPPLSLEPWNLFRNGFLISSQEV